MATCGNIKCTSIHLKLSKYFRCLGCYVACHPLWFIIVPIAITVLFSAGILRLELTESFEYLFFPSDSRTLQTKLLIEDFFPENATECDISRMTSMEKYGVIIATAKDDGSMLKIDIFEELHKLDENVRNVSVIWEGRRLTFSDICRKYEARCIENHVLSLRKKIKRLKRGHLQIRYPFDTDSNTSQIMLYGMGLGGVRKGDHNKVRDFKAVRLMYFIDYSNHTKFEIATVWEENFLKLLDTMEFQNIKISKFSGRSIEDEINDYTVNNLSLLVIAQFLMISFAVATCMTRDCVTSKPWIGIAGFMSSVLGVGTAFGLLLLCGMVYVDLNISVPIFVIGVGLDDSFVLLSAWKRTSFKDDIVKRMGDTYSEAAISITITTITNVIASLIGLTTPYPLVKVICIYMALSFAFAYVYQVTFFGGCLVLSGSREIKNIHAVFCKPVNWNQSTGLKKFLTAGISSHKENSSNKNFYRDIIGDILSYKSMKCFVIVIFIIYLSVGMYSLNFVSPNMDYADLYSRTSYAGSFINDDYKYFSEYRERIQVIINEPLDYSDKMVQEKLENLISNLENGPNMAGSSLTVSWFREYLKFINSPISWFSMSGYNTSHPQQFIEALREVFLKLKIAKSFEKDIIFNHNYSLILASRFFVQPYGMHNSSQQSKLLHQLYDVIDSSSLNVKIYCYELLFADSFVDILPYVIRSVCVSSVLVIVIFLIFIPNLPCAFSISLTVITIVTSTIGYISLWGVNINVSVMILLILIAGFCVDYAAHISCAYVCSKCSSPNEKIKDALHAAGHPVFQAGCSTILGVVVLIYATYRIFYDFFKIIFIVMTSSMFYAIFLIPVLLSIWDDIILMCRKRKSQIDKEDLSDHPNIQTQFLDNYENT